jgi:hypothetical protein
VKKQLTRDEAELAKLELNKLAKEVRYLLKLAPFKRLDRRTIDMMEHAWELLFDASAGIELPLVEAELPPKPPTKKPAPYKGGGTWHPSRVKTSRESW